MKLRFRPTESKHIVKNLYIHIGLSYVGSSSFDLVLKFRVAIVLVTDSNGCIVNNL